MDWQFEAERHRLAFGVEQWESVGSSRKLKTLRFVGRGTHTWWIECNVGGEGLWWHIVSNDHPDDDIGNARSHLMLSCGQVFAEHFPEEGSKYRAARRATEVLAKGAFRLGLPIDLLEQKHGELFTHHELIEARLSLPREFWPKAWEEEVAHTP